MPRPRSCDIDKAINKAINAATALFWWGSSMHPSSNLSDSEFGFWHLSPATSSYDVVALARRAKLGSRGGLS